MRFEKNGDQWVVVEACTVKIGHAFKGFEFRLNFGDRFDVSVPWGVRWIFSPDDPRYLRAAAVHDEMLRRHFSRDVAAAAFLYLLREDGVGFLERQAMFLGVYLKTVFFYYADGNRAA